MILNIQQRIPRTKYLKVLLLSFLTIALFIPLLFPLIVGKIFFQPTSFVTAHLFNILVEWSFLLYLLLVIKDTTYKPYVTDIHLISLLILASMLVSTLIGIDPFLGFWGDGNRGDGVFFHIHLVLFLFIITWTIKKDKEWFFFIHLLSIIGFIVATVGILATLFSSRHSFAPLASLGTYDLLFGNPSAFAHVLIILLPLFGFLLLTYLKTRHIHWIVYLVALGVLIPALYLSRSLTAVGLIGIVFALFLLYLACFYKKRYAFVFALLVAILFISGSFRLLHEGSGSFIYRLHVWNMIQEALPHKFITGYGWFPMRFIYDNFYDPWLNYLPNAHVDKAHNIFLEYLIATGVIGFSLVMLLWGYIFVCLLKPIVRDKETAALSHSPFLKTFTSRKHAYLMLFFTFLTHLMYLQFNLMFTSAYIYATLFIALTIVILPIKRINVTMPPATYFAVAFFSVPMMCVSSFMFNVKPLVVNYKIGVLFSELSPSSPAFNPETETIIQHAKQINHKDITHFRQIDSLALAYAELAQRGDITDQMRKTLYHTIKTLHTHIVTMHPRVGVNYAKLAFNEILLGRKFNPHYKRDAEYYLKKALSFSPKHGAYLFQLGKFYYSEGNLKEGCNIFTTLTRETTYPKIAHFYLGLCRIREDNIKEAELLIVESALALRDSREPFSAHPVDLQEMEIALDSAGYQEKTIPLYQALLIAQPKTFSLHYALITYYITRDLQKEATIQAIKTAHLFPDTIPLMKKLLKTKSTRS